MQKGGEDVNTKMFFNSQLEARERELAARLLATGWQSWSTSATKFFIFGKACTFSPWFDDSLPNLLNEPLTLKPPVRGWCSWYAFGPDINETKILQQAQWFSQHREIPIDYLLIDDGYIECGDWLDVSQGKFPYGIENTAQRIKDFGLRPGVWIAPFVAYSSSKLRRERPEFLAKDRNGFAVVPRVTRFDRFLPRRRFLLDFKHAAARTYLNRVIRVLIEDYGFELLKLDFLYAIYFDPALKPKEASDILHEFLVGIKRTYPHVYTIACGCPLIPAVGAVDSMRIGPDTTSPAVDGIPLANNIYNYFVLKGVLKNIRTRSWTRAYWNVDPDAFVCRKSAGFSERQILILQNAMREARGNLFLGDDMPKLSSSRIEEFILPLFH